MKATCVLWIDNDAAHARAAFVAISKRQPHWRVIHARLNDSLPLGEHAALLGGGSVVISLPDEAQTLPAQVAHLCAGHAVLLCVAAHQEALAARAYRCGIRDHVLRMDDQSHLGELVHRIEALVTAPVAVTRVVDASVWQQALAMLQQERSALQVTLASMSQGICKTGPDGRVMVYNGRVLELLSLPEALMARNPTLAEITRVQAERGDFGPQFEWIDHRGRDYVAGGLVGQTPEVYWRTTREGRTLEIRTATLPDGGIVRTYTDVTDYVQAQMRLRESEARFRSLSDLSSDWYWEQDEQYRFVHVAGDWSVNGMALDEVLGHTRWEHGALNMREEDWRVHQRILQARLPFRDLELHRARADGSQHWIAVSGVPVFEADGRFRGYRGVGRDISERKLAEGQIERLAFFDVLTGLPNRRLLTDRLERALAAVGRSGMHGALLFIDLDNFKDLNDTQGHDSGDRLLVQVAQRLQARVREVDTVARFGGDEFVVLLENLHLDVAQASAQAAQVASQIAEALAKPYTIGVLEHHSTPSIGIALFGRDSSGVEDLLKRADLAMYQAKAAGRNTQQFFDPAMQEAVSSRAVLQVQLRRGIDLAEFLLYCQPVVDGQGQLRGAEALLRWNHSQRGVMSPSDFIPLAEQTGLIVPLGQWVLRAACDQLVAWGRNPVTRALYISVNVSVRQFRQADFVDCVLQALYESGANPEQLKLELTESLMLTDVDDIIARMHRLREHGVSFSLDDFGTGYSSLSSLQRLPLEQIKIDQSFVRNIEHNPGDAAIVRTILALAQTLQLQVVAEGVETPVQLEFLKHLGCQSFQGYLFGRPMPSRVLDEALTSVNSGELCGTIRA